MIASLVKKDFLLVKKSVCSFFRNQYPRSAACDNPDEKYNANTRNWDVRFSLYGNLNRGDFHAGGCDGRRKKSKSYGSALCSTISPKKLCYSKIYLLHDLLRGLYCYLLDYRRRLSWTWFFEYRGSAGGLFGGGNPLWGIYPYRN